MFSQFGQALCVALGPFQLERRSPLEFAYASRNQRDTERCDLRWADVRSSVQEYLVDNARQAVDIAPAIASISSSLVAALSCLLLLLTVIREATTSC